MSLHPEDPPSPLKETRRVARAAFPKGTLCLRIADALGPVYQDSQFAALFPRRGQPAAAPGRLALATVLQFAEDLSDREAADAVRGRIDWKYALGLALTGSVAALRNRPEQVRTTAWRSGGERPRCGRISPSRGGSSPPR
jgi:transposase